MQTLTLTQPDDWHVHLRDGAYLTDTVLATARHFRRALIMPNLNPALVSVQAVLAYRERIVAALPQQYPFNPLMTLFLNETITPQEITLAKDCPFIVGAKLYPAGATTNTQSGVTKLQTLYPLLDLMQQYDLVLQIHGELNEGDVFDREALFLTEVLSPMIRNFPKLRIVLEHISTKAAVEFITKAPANIAATITPHHLLYDRNKLLSGGIRPHYYCLPILKREQDRIALQKAATSGNPKFFAGTDSAPHAQSFKENACGCAGIYSAPYALALYAQVFDTMNQLNKLNHFLGHFGAQFYGVAINSGKIMLRRTPQAIPATLPFGGETIVPIEACNTLNWSVHAVE